MKSPILIVLVIMTIFTVRQGEAQPAAESSRNGIIVDADNEADAVEACLREFVDLLNGYINGEAHAEPDIDRHFGGWLAKGNHLTSASNQPNREKLKILLSEREGMKASIQMSSEPPRRIGSSDGTLGNYVAILPTKNASFEFVALFFRVEAVDRVSRSRFDVALIPGLIFFGEPTR